MAVTTSDGSTPSGSPTPGERPPGPPIESTSIRVRSKAVLRRMLLAAHRRLIGEWPFHGRIATEDNAIYHLSIDGLTGPFMLVAGRIAIAGWALDLTRGHPLPVRVRLGHRTFPLEQAARPDLVEAFAGITDLPERCGFAFEAPVGTGLRLLTVEAAGRGGWTTIFRCIVAAAPRVVGPFRAVGTPDYVAWRERDLVRRADAFDAQRGMTGSTVSASVTTILIDGTDHAAIERTMASLKRQTDPRWDVLIVRSAGPSSSDHGSAASFAEAVRSARGDDLLLLEAGDILDPDAVFRLTSAARKAALDLVYADEERVSAAGTPFPVFKPGWSPDTLQAFDYVGTPALIRTEIARAIGAASRHDLLLRLTERAANVRHLPVILCRRETPRPPDDLGPRARRTTEPIDSRPLVSIVIPTAGGQRQVRDRLVDLAVNCVESIRTTSSYAPFEIIIVADAKLRAETRNRLTALGCRHVLDADADFNFSRKINIGVAAAKGEYLLLLNDDTQVIAPDWLESLLAQAVKLHVGVVGAKLLFPDDTIQHAGIVILNRVPLHVRQDFPAADRGFGFSTALPRNYAAVTGACMMVCKPVFETLGGFSEDFPVNFNDVDFCFRARRLGLSVVYEPSCVLYHFASSSRDSRVPTHEYRHFRDHWAAELAADPYYNNAGFSVGPPSFESFMRD